MPHTRELQVCMLQSKQFCFQRLAFLDPLFFQAFSVCQDEIRKSLSNLLFRLACQVRVYGRFVVLVLFVQ